MYKIFKKPILYFVGIGVGLGILSGVYASESGKNLGKVVGNTGTQIARGIFSIPLLGYDIVEKKWDPFTLAKSANDLVGKDIEYLAGTVSGNETKDIDEPGFIEEGLDNLGPAGNVIRGAETGLAIGGLVEVVRSAGGASVLAHHIGPAGAGTIYGAGAGGIKSLIDEGIIIRRD